MKRILPLLCLCCAACVSPARDDALPQPATDVVEDANQAIVSGVSGSDIWLGQLNRGAQWSITNLRNITTRPGYDNQPAFRPNGAGVFYTSIRDGKQADVYVYEQLVNAAVRYTSTPQSEFSPMPAPSGKGITVVRVEADGQQGLWRYAERQAFRLLADINDVGYYTWLDAQTVAMFRVTEPPSLTLASVNDGASQTIPVEPGRSLQVIPGTGLLSLVDKSDETQWWISSYDRDTAQLRRIAPTLDDSEDFAWTPDGELLMASGTTLFVWHDQWEKAVELDGRVSGNIGRLQVGPRGLQIVFVAAEGGS